MKITAKDVASRCGTSTAAVSRAFRAEATIRPELRAKILSMARELGYVPPAKRVQRTDGRKTISIIVGDISNPFYPNALETFAKEIGSRNHDMLVHVVPFGETVDSTISQVLRSGSDAAVIASANLSSELARECTRRGMPVVLFNRVQADPDVNAVCADNYHGGLLAAERLISRGCTSIAFLGGISDTSTHLERRRGFLDELEKHDTSLAAEISGRFDYGVSFLAVQELFQLGTKPDGLFCANDIMAFAAIDAAKQCGLEPGTDIAILGFDDVPMAAWTSYKLTTFRQRIRQMVTSALGLIEETWQDPEATGVLRMVRCGIVERSSG